jgi:hypothetical protein
VCSVHLYFMCGFTVPNDQLSFEFFKQSVNERGPTRQTIDFDCIAQQNSWESIHPSLCALVRSIFWYMFGCLQYGNGHCLHQTSVFVLSDRPPV